MEELIQIRPAINCVGNHEAGFICCSQACRQTAFMCLSKKCTCWVEKHKSCSFQQIDNIMSKVLEKKKKQVHKDAEEGFKAIDKILDNMIQELSNLKDELQNNLQNYWMKEGEATFAKLLSNAETIKKIDGKLVHKVFQQLSDQCQIMFTSKESVQSYWQQNKYLFAQTCDQLLWLFDQSKLANPLYMSTITDQAKLVTKFIRQTLQRPIKNYTLLYRASQNHFGAAAFHAKCDGKENTLVVIHTEFDKVIGGFTPLAWNKENKYQKDQSGNTFIFSLTLKEIFRINNVDHAISGSSLMGPIFGGGHDIGICGDANARANSYSKFPNSFGRNDYVCDQETWKLFSGAEVDNKYKIKQWEVYQVIL